MSFIYCPMCGEPWSSHTTACKQSIDVCRRVDRYLPDKDENMTLNDMGNLVYYPVYRDLCSQLREQTEELASLRSRLSAAEEQTEKLMQHNRKLQLQLDRYYEAGC